MLTEIDWLDKASADEAFNKLNRTQVDIGYPEWIFDDNALDKAYEKFDVNKDNDNYFSALDKLRVFTRYVQFREVVEPVDRAKFIASPIYAGSNYKVGHFYKNIY